MRAKEAIEQIDAIWETVERSELPEAQWEALRTAKDALEMQVPKAPIGISKKYGMLSGKCPMCMKFIYETQSHCSCGNMIDWEKGKNNE